jgi:catabolite regulation protein CreA
VLNPKTAGVISTIYPPPTATSIDVVTYCLYKQRVFILLKTGALCVYRILDTHTSVLEMMQYPNQLKDGSGKSITQAITTMTLASTIPPKYDCELFTKVKQVKEKVLSFFAS